MTDDAMTDDDDDDDDNNDDDDDDDCLCKRMIFFKALHDLLGCGYSDRFSRSGEHPLL